MQIGFLGQPFSKKTRIVRTNRTFREGLNRRAKLKTQGNQELTRMGNLSYYQSMQISVVIPTCNRQSRLLSLLHNLNNSGYSLLEVIIVDSGQQKLQAADLAGLAHLSITYLDSEQSVCIQRNIGIKKARGQWVFICDDDIEVPPDYLAKISQHISCNPDAGAISGIVLQKEAGHWQGSYPVTSTHQLLWKYLFQQSIWGEIRITGENFLARRLKRYYQRKGNHLSKAGWPVITQFSDGYFTCPVYGLGASVVRREWLLRSLYPEVLDRHGIGDNYGVAMNFPGEIHVLTNAWVYHHQETINRLHRPLQYFRRVLALDYFMKTSERLRFVKKGWLLWSLIGNLLQFIFVGDRKMIRPAWKAIHKVLIGNNPYYEAARLQKKIIEPVV